MTRQARELWVFGYGSLMWRPGFAFAEAHHARLTGYHRALCVYSVLYRGTRDRPGLVLGLDRGGVCEGVAYRIAPEAAPSVLRYVRDRELIYGVYREVLVPLELMQAGRKEVMGLTYIAERAHPSYAGRLRLETQARVVRMARGSMGTNIDYVFNTVRHLEALAIRDVHFERLQAIMGAVIGRESGSALGCRASSEGIFRALRNRPSPALAQRPDQVDRFQHRRSRNP